MNPNATNSIKYFGILIKIVFSAVALADANDWVLNLSIKYIPTFDKITLLIPPKVSFITLNFSAFDFDTIITFFKSYIQFIISPIGKINNIYLLIIGFETICIYLFVFNNFYKDIRIKKLNRIVKTWIIILSGYVGIYCMFIYNAGQLTRYRYVLLFFVMIGYEIHKKITLNKKIR